MLVSKPLLGTAVANITLLYIPYRRSVAGAGPRKPNCWVSLSSEQHIHDGNYRYLTECGISWRCSPGGRNSFPSVLGTANSLDSYQTMTLITRLRKLEGIGVDTVRAELVQLINQSLKDSEQDLQVITVSGCSWWTQFRLTQATE